MSTPGSQLLIIVSREEPLVCVHLTQVFAENERVEVVLDRRVARRRSPDGQPAFTRDRRQHDVGSSLDRLGWAIVLRPRGEAAQSATSLAEGRVLQ